MATLIGIHVKPQTHTCAAYTRMSWVNDATLGPGAMGKGVST